MDTFDEVDRLRTEIKDPIQLWRALSDLQEVTTGLTVHLAAARTEVVQELLRDGLSLQKAAERLGISKTRAAQISAQRTA